MEPGGKGFVCHRRGFFRCSTKNFVLSSSYTERGDPMARTNVPRPTEAELGILGVLWDRGPSTVREVHGELARSRPLGYTTVLKLLQIMSRKGLVRRNERERAHVY